MFGPLLFLQASISLHLSDVLALLAAVFRLSLHLRQVLLCQVDVLEREVGHSILQGLISRRYHLLDDVFRENLLLIVIGRI